ncbi:MAG: hypothetical protein JO345_19955 [Streptosporangiaceae bacterium]|nr:hypothetical protein [Streptosporangiaceae bacterium]
MAGRQDARRQIVPAHRVRRRHAEGLAQRPVARRPAWQSSLDREEHLGQGTRVPGGPGIAEREYGAQPELVRLRPRAGNWRREVLHGLGGKPAGVLEPP